MTALHHLWDVLGKPSYISGILSLAVTILSWMSKRVYSKIKELNNLHQKLDLLCQEVRANKELLNQRIDDMNGRK
jgi:CHASE3 domain sensor protein